MVIEQFIRNSDNQIRIALLEDGVAISGLWDELDIYFGGVHINRTTDSDGVSLSTVTGVLVINPANLTADELTAIDLLTPNRVYRVKIVVTSAPNNEDGVVFGGPGSGGIVFNISDKPVAA